MLRELGLFSLQKTQLRERSHQHIPIREGKYKEEEARLFAVVPSDSIRGSGTS